MNPIRRPMKKRNPSSGQNGQLVHWWVLIHFGPRQHQGVLNITKMAQRVIWSDTWCCLETTQCCSKNKLSFLQGQASLVSNLNFGTLQLNPQGELGSWTLVRHLLLTTHATTMPLHGGLGVRPIPHKLKGMSFSCTSWRSMFFWCSYHFALSWQASIQHAPPTSCFGVTYFLILVLFVLCPFGLNMKGILSITCVSLHYHWWWLPIFFNVIPLLGLLNLHEVFSLLNPCVGFTSMTPTKHWEIVVKWSNRYCWIKLLQLRPTLL